MSNTGPNHDPIYEPGIDFLSSRVRSFASDPLHSAAYLSNLSTYMNKPFQKSVRQTRYATPTSSGNTFLYSYEISGTRPEKPTTYDKVASFKSDTSSSKSELVFLAGYPSPEWLNAIVSCYGIDHRFLHRHLNFLPSGQRDWFTAPDVPSRSEHFIRLLIPSIVFLGSEKRHVPVKELYRARNACSDQLRKRAKSFFGGLQSSTGNSIIRNVNIHTGDMIVLEQAISITILKRQESVKVLVWTDSGTDPDSTYVPIPDTDGFHKMADFISYCPVFFERDLQQNDAQSSIADPRANTTQQPLSVLPARYGETLDWTQLPADPLLIVRELFTFQSAATIQYFNMLQKNISQMLAQSHPIDGSVNMEHILHFEYAKTVLVKWTGHLRTLIQSLDTGPLREGRATPTAHEERKVMLLSLKGDLEFLQNEANNIINLCESGKSTILSNFSIAESRRTTEEAKLVTQLTKATNRLTFIFLPISFITSVFGMNFRQFGQGTLSILLWVEVTLPLLAVSIILVEWGRQITTYGQKLLSNAFGD